MTKQKPYSVIVMEFLSNLMSVKQAWGGVATLFLFVFSFVIVHAVKLSSKGYSLYRQENEEKKTEDPEPEESRQKPKPQAEVAPVYYLVEKKRVRKKPTAEYAEPKRIRLEEEERV